MVYSGLVAQVKFTRKLQTMEEQHAAHESTLADPAVGAAAELRHLRLLIHDAMERTEMAPVSLKQEVTEAFSVVRTAINAAVQSDRLRNSCLDAVEDCESKYRQRLTTLHAQHLSFLQELVGHENEPNELRESWAKRKSAEFLEITRIPDLRYLTEYPKIPAGTVTPDFARNRPSSAVWQKETVHVSSTTGKKLEYKSPQPWEPRLPRPESAVPRGTSAQQRPHSSLGFAQRDAFRREDMGASIARPQKFSKAPTWACAAALEASAGIKHVVLPHAIPNLKADVMPTRLDHWPARFSSPQSTDIFVGRGGEEGKAEPARGYMNASSRMSRCLETNKPSEPLSVHTEIEALSSIRPVTRVTTSPAEMATIQHFIDVEFKKANCQLDEFNARRLSVFRRALDFVANAFKSWAPLLKTIQYEYESYVTSLEAQSDEITSLKTKIVDLEKDFSHKFEFMREETARVVARVQAEADRQVSEADEKVKAQLERKAQVEEWLEKERAVVADLSKKLPEVEFQLRILLKAYNSNLKDCNSILQAAQARSVGDLVHLYKSMVHVQALWDLEKRLTEEKKVVVAEKDTMYEKYLAMADNYRKEVHAKKTFEQSYAHMVMENETICKFFGAQFPEAKQLRLKENGKLYLLDAEGKLKEATLKAALANLRINLNELQKRLEVECVSNKHLRSSLVEVLKGDTVDEHKEQEYFSGAGEGPEIPEVLQSTGQIKNKNLSLEQVERTAKSMFEQRKRQEEAAKAKGLTVELPDIWTAMTAKAHAVSKSRQAQLEWAYSFVDGLKKYSKEKLVIRVFKDMLDGNAVPEVFYEAESIVSKIWEKAIEKDKEQRTNGRMPVKIFQNLVEKFFKPVSAGGSGYCKEKLHLGELFRRLKNDELAGVWGVTPKEIEIKKLFPETKEGARSYFVLGIMEQFVADRSMYIMDIIMRLRNFRQEEVTETSPKDLMTAIKVVDPNKNFEQVDYIVKKVFGEKPKSLPNAEFERRIKGVFTYRSTDRTLPHVQRALRPKTLLLISGQRKLRRNELMLRICKCFRLAGADFRRKNREQKS